MKNLRKQKKKAKLSRKQKLAEMTPEEREAFQEEENLPNYADLYNAAVWDFEHSQLAFTKYHLVGMYCDSYVEELKEREQTPFIIGKIESVKKFKEGLCL